MPPGATDRIILGELGLGETHTLAPTAGIISYS